MGIFARTWFRRNTAAASAAATASPADALVSPSIPPVVKILAKPTAPDQLDNGVGHLSMTLAPGHPVSEGEPVPRWPEHGAAMMSASPEELLETQRELLDGIRSISPLSGADFDTWLMPVFNRYACWVHLLPASESHHHFGPGGLLRHGFEVALHAARMAEGKHVGLDLPPSVRVRYEVRWRVATMLAGLVHDLGKPLVDCGATNTERSMTWPSGAGDLYAWLQENNLKHYRIYWRAGERHERHKPVGTAVTREILGKDILRWLSNEPTQEVVSLLMMSIAQGRTANNVMSIVVSKADSMSVEEDLKRLAQRTQASGEGGTKSAAALIMSELRNLIEQNRIQVNKPGSPLWTTSEGCFGAYPAILDSIMPALAKRSLTSLPANRGEIAELLADTGFIEPCVEDSKDGKQRSLTWDLVLTLKRGGEMTAAAPIKVLRFTDPGYVFGSLPLPAPAQADLRAPFVTAEQAKKIADSVRVDVTPQQAPQSAAEGNPGTVVAAEVGASTESAPDAQSHSPEGSSTAAPSATVKSDEDEAQTVDAAEQGNSALRDAEQPGTPSEAPHVEDRRNRRDQASERDRESKRESVAQTQRGDLVSQIKKIAGAGLFGPACAQVLRNIYDGRMVLGTDYFDTTDGLAVVYPESLEGMGLAPEDVLGGAADEKWVVIETGSERRITDRGFPDGRRRKCVIFTGQMGSAWQTLMEEYPEVLEKRPKVTGEKTAASESAQAIADGDQSKAAPDASDSARKTPERRQEASSASSGKGDRAVRAPVQPASRPVAMRIAPDHPTDDASPAKPGVRQRPAIARPAVGAQPVPGVARSARERPRAQSADTRPISPNTSEQMGRAPHNRRGEEPRGKEAIQCNVISELTPELIANINGFFVLTAMHLVMTKPDYDLERAEDLKAVIRFLNQKGSVRPAPLLTALATQDNPALLLTLPDSLLIADIKKVKLNPDYVKPEWLERRIAEAKRKKMESDA